MTNKFFLKISLLISALTLLIIAAVLTSCKCRACEDQEEGSVPLEVLTKADSFIVALTSKNFFDKYITADFARTRHTPPYYEMAYRFFMPDKIILLNDVLNVFSKYGLTSFHFCVGVSSSLNKVVKRESGIPAESRSS